MAVVREVVGRAHQNFVLLFGDAHLRKGGLPFKAAASVSFHDGPGITAVAVSASRRISTDELYRVLKLRCFDAKDAPQHDNTAGCC
jgi:hypothetical protein